MIPLCLHYYEDWHSFTLEIVFTCYLFIVRFTKTDLFSRSVLGGLRELVLWTLPQYHLLCDDKLIKDSREVLNTSCRYLESKVRRLIHWATRFIQEFLRMCEGKINKRRSEADRMCEANSPYSKGRASEAAGRDWSTLVFKWTPMEEMEFCQVFDIIALGKIYLNH